ncbi:hypothetical protein ACWV95_35275 [Streptomyces albus]
MTWRDDPILPVCAAGLPPEENHTIWGTMISASALDVLRSAELPVEMAWCSYEAATCWIVVSVNRARRAALGMTEQRLVDAVAETLFSSHAGWLVPKVILVDDDIDVTDIRQVVWALATRSHPGTGHHHYPQAPGIPMVPYLTPRRRAARGAASPSPVVCCPTVSGAPPPPSKGPSRVRCASTSSATGRATATGRRTERQPPPAPDPTGRAVAGAGRGHEGGP